MIRRSLAIASLALLVGCAGQNPPATPNPTIERIQQAAVGLCGYLPYEQTASQIVAALTNWGDVAAMVNQAAEAICAAATSHGARRGAIRVVRLADGRSIALKGRFVKGRFAR